MNDAKWGTIWGDDDRVHLVPCDDAGFVLEPHVASNTCSCRPEVDHEDGIVTHRVLH